MNIGVVGLGLIGGSLAKAIKANSDHIVYGMDISAPVVYKAKLLDAIDDELTSDRIGLCDIIIVAIYPHDTVSFLQEHSSHIKKGSIVVDCCGVKEFVCKNAWELAEQYGYTFIGGHPMEGLEKSGFEHAKKNLFNNASMIFVPNKDIDIETMKRLKDIFDAIGFTRYEITSPKHHDELIAYTSQLAHVASNAYIKSPTASEHQGFSAGSFRDMTRVAYLNETMWTELFMLNRDSLIYELDLYISNLQEYSDALHRGDEQTLKRLLKEGRERKSQLS